MDCEAFIGCAVDDDQRGTKKSGTQRTGDHAPHTCWTKHAVKNSLSSTLTSTCTCIITPHASMAISKRNLGHFVIAPALNNGPKSWRFVCVCVCQHVLKLYAYRNSEKKLYERIEIAREPYRWGFHACSLFFLYLYTGARLKKGVDNPTAPHTQMRITE